MISVKVLPADYAVMAKFQLLFTAMVQSQFT
jgi:hypothetical protein